MAESIRLSKVAKELGVGVATIIQFLDGKGIDVSGGPNTKVDEKAHDLLLAEFQKDKQVKDKSKELSKNKVVRETITLDDTPKKIESEPEDELPLEPIEEVRIKTSILKEVVKPEEDSTPKTPKLPDTPQPEPEKPVEQQVGGLNIKGKIDLDSLNQKTRPDKKKTEKPTETKKEEPQTPQPKAEEPVSAAKEEPELPIAEEKTEPPVETKETPERKEPEEHITQYEKLSGPKVLGKIELPAAREKKPKEEKEKKPVASSSEKKIADRDKRKKRKRIGSENTGQGNNNQQQGNRKGKGNIGKKATEEKTEIDEAAIQNQIKETLARLTGGGKSKSVKYRKAKRDAISEEITKQREQTEAEKSIIKATEFLTANDLATLMNVSVTQVISACMSIGLFVSINQRLDAETIVLVAEEFGYKVEFTSEELTETTLVEDDNEANMVDRPPIVTVMGHVDHGKTSLLDFIRKENVIAGEAGGITQHIGAYSVTLESGKTITFLDTPGHEAFTAMRSRGAQVTDVVIVVIAADDSVMPQTKEAINHAQAAGVPIVFALNKIDRPEANPNKIKEELANMNILVEDWGGKYQCQEISAKSGLNVDLLLDKVLLEAEILDLKADPKKRGHGTVIEATLDKGKGFLTTILVQSGSISIGDFILAGPYFGKIRAMSNERGSAVKLAGPSTPVSILGLNGAPNAGDKFVILEDEREAKNIANKRLQLQREQGVRTKKHITLDEIGRRLAIGDFQELNIIVKGDVDGSIEALTDSLLNLSTEKIQVNVILKAVGQITESDVLLASASNAIIIGFNVRPSSNARKLAEKEEIEIRNYSIIYQAIEEVKDAMEGMLKPTVEEQIVGNAEIRETFKISKVGTIAGCYVTDGRISRNHKVRVIRDGIVIYSGLLGSLKRFKDDVKEVKSGYECGLNIENFNDIKVGDVVEAFEEVEVKQSL